MALLNPVAPLEVPCKCCSARSTIYGVVDFNKNCEERRGPVLAPSGVPIYYHRCTACEFIFTVAFDHFSDDDFRAAIYNDQYKLVDPDYLGVRPNANAKLVAQLLGENHSLQILDYGGGSGAMAMQVRAAGYVNTQCYDPMVPEFSKRPEQKFDCIFSFEVAEHSPKPRQTIADMASLLNDPGIIIYTTLFQPAQQMSLAWWYAAPRNGHVSLFSRRSMEGLAKSVGLKPGSFNDNLHVLYREIPHYAKPWFGMK